MLFGKTNERKLTAILPAFMNVILLPNCYPLP